MQNTGTKSHIQWADLKVQELDINNKTTLDVYIDEACKIIACAK